MDKIPERYVCFWQIQQIKYLTSQHERKNLHEAVPLINLPHCPHWLYTTNQIKRVDAFV